ncbi:MAG TPA: hypothetical protein VJH95_04160 [Candidatus Nanoarchaeia archaeon]|nr:hypothetical protein [Candidatus Nanoarchaeia archaeon]
MKINKCPECEGEIKEKHLDYLLMGINLGKFPTLVCSKCESKFYDDVVVDRIEKIAKKKGLWGLEHRTKLNVLGNSLAVRLSKSQIDFSGLKKGEEVVIYPESKSKFVIEVPHLRR